jgi:hypothetical protein
MRLERYPAAIVGALAMLASGSATIDYAGASDSKAFRMIVGEPRFMDPTSRPTTRSMSTRSCSSRWHASTTRAS